MLIVESSEPKLLFSSADASLLLRKLEDIAIKTSEGAGSDYLGVFSRRVQVQGQSELLKELKLVRLALARYFARSVVFDA